MDHCPFASTSEHVPVLQLVLLRIRQQGWGSLTTAACAVNLDLKFLTHRTGCGHAGPSAVSGLITEISVAPDSVCVLRLLGMRNV